MPSPPKADYALLPLHDSPPPAYPALPQNHTTTQGPEPTTSSSHSESGSHDASRDEDLRARMYTDVCAAAAGFIVVLCTTVGSFIVVLATTTSDVFAAACGFLVVLCDTASNIVASGHVKYFVMMGVAAAVVYVIAPKALALYHELLAAGGRAHAA
ncbi:unnamed protein product [Peniophora sp. CBMAI 1063]|nr:unnamed protein product [Peniophora sp. CBMAI 1063]